LNFKTASNDRANGDKGSESKHKARFTPVFDNNQAFSAAVLLRYNIGLMPPKPDFPPAFPQVEIRPEEVCFLPVRRQQSRYRRRVPICAGGKQRVSHGNPAFAQGLGSLSGMQQIFRLPFAAWQN